MNLRAKLRKTHIYIAVFLTPFVLLITLSGVLEVLGVNGKMHKQLLYTGNDSELDFRSPVVKNNAARLLKKIVPDISFNNIKVKRRLIYTRPTYTTHYSIKLKKGKIHVYKNSPSLIRKLMILHKGNGPAFYQIYQKAAGIGLLVILLIGVYLGLASPSMRKNTLLVLASGIGFYLFAIY